ncbi:MAG: restriction endonuclease subunit S [Rectinemataceae bacterium]|jgi:type I restriction enzyme S subunit
MKREGTVIDAIRASIPPDWNARRLKYIANIQFSNVDKNIDEGEVEVQLCNYVDVYKNDFVTSHLDFMKASASLAEIEKFLLHKGDVLLTKDSETADDIGIPAYLDEEIERLVCGYHLAILRSKKGIDGKYLFRFLSSRFVASYFETRANGITRFAIGLDTVGSSLVFYPEFAKQRAIADYLDKHSARIDELIVKKEKQVELLQEKRQAIITRAATKGLDPNAKMKDSGIEWIGEIPVGWEVKRLCFCVSFISGATPDKGNDLYWDGDIPWVSPKDMKRRYIQESIDHISEDAVKEAGLRFVPKRTILVVVRGMILVHSFPVAITTTELTINQDIKALIFRSEFDLEYAAYLLSGLEKVIISLYIEISAHGTKVLRLDGWKDFPVLYPPLEEQRKIADFIKDRTKSLDSIIETIEKSIILLREYRSSLITAAVSGQIDVSHEEAIP